MAATGMAVSQICDRLNLTVESIVGAASSHGIKIARHTAAEQEEIRARLRANGTIKKRKQRQKHKTVDETRLAAGLPAASKTSPAYRNQLPGIGERTKTELRAMLAEAARNTAEMSV
ncbi:hypothetical protein RPMA_12320 [Tardiphaga alba]|uniref:Translation initiation factor IF-2 N-terminal domain-containing protein n=1 Tax=Tardiphaga alba TaxID=340268 RepID=A0ABX8A8F9_9BRAD|nr:hypothetical protein [Tardiphaga alba]QUS39532.1 hypothetical protein RPMA_12320 [Tardiphaga alba]